MLESLAKEGVEFGSEIHQSCVELRPVDPALRVFLGTVIEKHGHLAIEPLQLLAVVLNEDSEVAERFAHAGLNAEVVRAAAHRTGAG